MTTHPKLGTGLLFLAALALLAMPTQQALALIVGGEGNKPLQDPGWPDGASVIFNTPSRIAWWEGPPLGGGQWHAECRGDAKALSTVLADFAELNVKSKRIVLYDGVGKSFWPSRVSKADKGDATKMDWMFTVWMPASWERLRKLPPDINPIRGNAGEGPPAQIDIYTGGNIKWADVVVPKGITIVDNRLEAHGFTVADGLVFEGKVIDLATRKPIAAKVRLDRYDPKAKGGYVKVVETVADEEGHWVLKKAPTNWNRVVIDAEGYVPRDIGYNSFDGQPRWHEFNSGLARPATVKGRVTDDDGEPLADVDVRLGDVTSGGDPYASALDSTVKTGKDGSFQVELPVGKATVWVHKPGYVRPGLGMPIKTPNKDVVLKMVKSCQVEVTVDFTGKKRPAGYIVRITPDGGDKIGSFGGSGNINKDDKITFDHIPPGKYTFTGRPNPGADKEETEGITVELRAGQSAKVTLNAK